MKKSTAKKASERKTENLIDELVKKDVLRVKTTLRAATWSACARGVRAARAGVGALWAERPAALERRIMFIEYRDRSAAP